MAFSRLLALPLSLGDPKSQAMHHRLLILASSGLLLLSGACSERSFPSLPEPYQFQLSQDSHPEQDRRLHSVAGFSADVAILSRKRYRKDPVNDPLSAFSPLDIVAAWGPATGSNPLRPLKMWQDNRRYVWRYDGNIWNAETVRRFAQSTSNWHLIPGSPSVARMLSRIGPGDRVRIEGDLVNVDLVDPAGSVRTALTSTVRTDVEDGACEIILVRSIRVVP